MNTELTIETTSLCNFRCTFCYNEDDQNDSLPNDKFYDLIDEIYDLGIRRIDLTPDSGEIFTDRNALQKIMYACSRMKYVEFMTNMSLCYPYIQNELSKLDNLKIIISDYSAKGLESFKKITNSSEDNYLNTVENVKYCKDNLLNAEFSKRIPYDNSDEKQSNSGWCGNMFRPSISGNGDVYACSFKPNGNNHDLLLGNIYNDNLKSILSSKKRNDLIKNELNSYCKACKDFSTSINPSLNDLKILKGLK